MELAKEKYKRKLSKLRELANEDNFRKVLSSWKMKLHSTPRTQPVSLKHISKELCGRLL